MKGFRGISDDRVRERTGKCSEEWHRILDEWGAREKGHTLAAKHLLQEYGLSPWWSQAVTIRWEYERGLREEG